LQFVDHVKSEKGRSLRVLVERGDHVVPNIQVSKDDGALCTMCPCSLSPEFLIESTTVERGDHVDPNIQVSKDDGTLCTVYPCSLRPKFLIESTTV